MFDKIINEHTSKVVAITKEIEKQISPDKVVEMYDSVKEEVISNIVKKIAINNSVFKGSIIAFKDSLTHESIVKVKIKLNSIEFVFSKRISNEELNGAWEASHIVRLLAEAYSEFITSELLKLSISKSEIRNLLKN